MATISFLGSGNLSTAFNVDNVLVAKSLIVGEVRLRTPFPYPTLERWRGIALQFSAAAITTGSSDIATRGRTALLFAHEADLGSIFFDLTEATAEDLQGWYVDKVKAKDAANSFAAAILQRDLALAELKQLGVPDQYNDLLKARLESPSFNYRTAGFCGTVYLAALLLEEANK